MQIDQLWIYPVKSMLGATVPDAELAESGVVGDRMWTLRDEGRGAIASARKVAGLSKLAATYTGAGVTITLPDGSTVTDSDADANERLSAAVDHPVSLWAKRPADDLDFYRRGRPDSDDILTEMRSIFGRTEDEPLPDFSVFPPEMIEFEYPPGNYFDCYPLMIMTTSALRSIREALPDSVIDERRFRPSMVIDTGDEPGHPEFAWTGRRLRIGSTELQIGAACPRCVVVTREFADDLPGDRSVLRHVVKDLDQNVGVYATVITGGHVSAGDHVELL
ncbi:MAG: MOSC N-terminal beta barrel domain-containing protein [Ilumatobacteraceae bacterium]